MPSIPQSKNWCFTLNNYGSSDYERICGLGGSDSLEYLVVGREVGESGTRHLQGFLVLKRKKTMGGVKTLLGSTTVHLEIARGSAQQASDYCKKEGDYYESGSCPSVGQGRRTDLIRAAEAVVSGRSLDCIAAEFPVEYVKYYRGLGELRRKLLDKPRDFRTQCVWFWGPTGTGKSFRAHDEANRLCGGSVYSAFDPSCKWFDGYDSHKGVIFDDFAGEAPIAVLLQLLDRYPRVVQVKGGAVQWRPRIVWFTSNFPPDRLYLSERQLPALLRRIDEISEITEENKGW